MTNRAPTLTNTNHKKLDVYLRKLMTAVRDGQIEPELAASEFAHLLAAVDIGNYTEPLSRAERPDEFVDYFIKHR